MQSVEIAIPGNPIALRRKRGEIRHGRVVADPSSQLGRVLAAVQAQAPATLFTGWVFMEVLAHVLPPKRVSRRTRAAMLAGDVVPAGRTGLDALMEFWADILGAVVYIDSCQVHGAVMERRYSNDPRVNIRVREVHRPELRME